METVILIWKQFRESGHGTCNLSDILPLLEQTVMLVGQTFHTVNYQRRVGILAQFVRTKAAEFVRKHEANMPAGKEFLGSLLLEVLMRKT